ncbi:hypothetical protein L1987_70698 [Smallanthus sonchifolius]|uniref:Uncharacterized protein n=1 Tax=Smallanthus sonchifolius TaxID=185202 RepID=A0ACB9AR84_9ASTR|nr:hypothetical protein L1987_70698 [Smallanthus sonchifolius]
MGLATWAQDSIKEGRLKQIVDSNLRGTISSKCTKEFAELADRCLHSNQKKCPTMAEVVGGLESILALHQKTNKTLLPMDKKIFGIKVPAFHLPSSHENSEQVGCIQMDVIHLTRGNLEPEYVMHGHLSTKTDVFDFGTLILETITRRSICSVMHGFDQIIHDVSV